MKRSKKVDAVDNSQTRAEQLKVRFEATIYPGRRSRTKGWADQLDIDRVPDAKGRVRALITIEDCVRLLDQGLEVRLYRAHRYEPLDPALVETDESFRRWLDERLGGLKGNRGPKPFLKP
jgi:hypothetical protein